MAGQRHRSHDDETGTVQLAELLADVDGRRALQANLAYGRLYLRRPGQAGDYEGLLVGNGGGFCWRRFLSPDRARRIVAAGVDHGGSVETGRGVWPSKWEGGS